MKGMLIKDFRLLKNQGKTLLLMLLIVAIFMYFITDVGPSFIVGYITIIFSLFTATTISYDEFDNCYLFLMTLPITRKKYVNEKYIFALVSTVCTWVVGTVLGTAMLLVRPEAEMNAAEWMGSCLGYMFAAWICVSIMLPIRLKFDSEKSRYANLIMIAVVFIAEFLISSAIDYLPVRIVEAGKEWLYGLSAGGVLGMAAGITAAAVLISYLCSRHIMAKKEF
ncbi:MAG TPA: ABC-2 transporter permease [Candidatus Mediterraneibacter faecigallinarum]|uniref:ABC-2 transporter permease n=1 Tax=Candidatus Mediterraneibacter faecigallinarum TaxID=2838669 RepID=A0A9D2SZ56_9FIRM|nr:ABC-2 transporter permease [Candidatus Mediterraneibacter faecigallinarum]